MQVTPIPWKTVASRPVEGQWDAAWYRVGRILHPGNDPALCALVVLFAAEDTEITEIGCETLRMRQRSGRWYKKT